MASSARVGFPRHATAWLALTLFLPRPASAQHPADRARQVSPFRAVATGDFAVTAPQLQPLLSTLAANGVTATGVHHHLVGEEPRLYFVHFWGDAPLTELLRALRAAVDATRPE